MEGDLYSSRYWKFCEWMVEVGTREGGGRKKGIIDKI